MKRMWMILAGAASAALAVTSAPADLAAQGRVTLTLASLAPEGSVWDIELRQMASEWGAISGGRVRLQVAPGGRLGTDSQIITQLRAGVRPEAAALTTGLGLLDEGYNVFSLPFFFGSLAEISAVADALEPVLARRLDAQGLTFLAWGFGGWVHIFSKAEIASIAELKKARLFTSAGDSAFENWYRRNGFTPVPLSQTDIAASLASGGINAMPAPPYAALVFQWYRETPYMLDVELTPLMGAIVVNTGAWNRVPADIRAKLVESAKALEKRLEQKIPTQDLEAVKEMQQRSLRVLKPAADFAATSRPLVESMRGALVPNDIYDLAVKARDGYRQARR